MKLNWKPSRHYYVKVDYEAARTLTTDAGLSLIVDREEGSVSTSLPFHGELVLAPDNSRIPIGETVYMNFKAQETDHKIDGDDYFIVTDDLIVAWGEDKQAYKCITVRPEFQGVESEWLELPDYLFEDQTTTKGNVLSSDNEWFEEEGLELFNAGDEIVYSKNLDWEYIVNRARSYYIQWTHRIFMRNGELINGYNELAEKDDDWVEKDGLYIPNKKKDRFYDVLRGKFGGLRVLPQEKSIELGKYIKNEEIFGHLT
jgi:hypothetical protein